MKKITALVLAFTMILSISATSFASATVSDEKLAFDIIESEVFEPQKMTVQQRENYYSIIDEEVKKASQKYGKGFDSEAFKKELIWFLETENSMVKMQRKSYSHMMARSGSWVPDVKIKNSIAAAGFNTAITMVVTGGVAGAGVKEFLEYWGEREAKRLMKRTLLKKLKGWGMLALATKIDDCIEFVFDFLDPGIKIAEYLDSVDSYPNNGYIDLIL